MDLNYVVVWHDSLRQTDIQHNQHYSQFAWGCIQKFPDWPPGATTAIGTALCY